MALAVHLGHVFHVAGAPDVADAPAALVSIPDGALVVDEVGRIAFCGQHGAIPAQFIDATVHDHRPGFLLPGFVDTHVHFPQTYCADSYGGGQLLEWLENCIFPAEARFADPAFAARAAAAFCDRRIAAGTTAAMVFGSAFPVAQDALFAETARRGLRMVSGRGIQTVGPAAAGPLLTSEADAIALTQAEIDAWHGGGDGLLQVAVVPRFSLSVTSETLRNLGELYDGVRERGVYVHTHLNENDRPGTGEIAAVRAAYGTETYLDTYDGRFLPGSAVGGASLLGRRTVLAHAVHCTEGELARMAQTGTSIAHCPVSQLFLGSGTMPWRRTVGAGVTVAAGTDFAAGDEWLIPRVLGDAYKVHMGEPGDAAVALHPGELLFLGTLAGARALDQEDRFGNFDAGKEADFVVVDPAGTPTLAAALENGPADEVAVLFRLLLGVRESSIAAVWVRGRRV